MALGLMIMSSILAGAGAVSFLLRNHLISPIYYALCISCGFAGLVLGAKIGIGNKRHRPVVVGGSQTKVAAVLEKITASRQKQKMPKKRIVISHNIDESLQEILDLAVRDYLLSWYLTVANDRRIIARLEADIWEVIANLYGRLREIDTVKMITQDFVCKLTRHFQEVKVACERPKCGGARAKFVLVPWLASEETELEFLRRIAELFILNSLPESYTRCPITKQLIREILVCKVLKPCVELICEPDYINQQMVQYLDWRDKLAQDSARTYRFAASYEDFIQMIQQCDDMEHLKQVRYTIISEIMQATTINNLKKARGPDFEKDNASKGTNKGDLLKARNLKRYINQLTVCKSLVEKRIRLLGGADYKSYGDDQLDSNLPGHKVLSFSVIMNNPVTRDYFVRYLKRSEYHSLMGFWLAVGNMKGSEKEHRYKLAGNIFHMFIASASSVVRLDRMLLREMEAFLKGDTGPGAFYTAQKNIYTILEEQHYPSFIVSDIYHLCISNMTSQELNAAVRADLGHSGSYTDSICRSVSFHAQDASFGDFQAYHASRQLAHIDEKRQNKVQALAALKLISKADPKRTKLLADMEREIADWQEEIIQLESHMERTAVWCDNIGRWSITVETAELLRGEDDRDEVPYVRLLVSLPNLEQGCEPDMVHAWMVSRNLAQFAQLHQQLVQISPWLKKKELPAVSKFRFGPVKRPFLDRATRTLAEYLLTVLHDDRLSQSEALYAFLSPSPQYLKPSRNLEPHKAFSIAKLFKTLPSKDQDDSDDELFFFDDDNSRDDRSKDSIAQSLYSLIEEVFELKGVFRWLRRTLIVFVQVTFGRTINKQLRDTMDWLFSEPMLIYYLATFRHSWWPNGRLADWASPRTDQDKIKTRLLAKEKFLSFIQELSKNLIGENNAKRGAIKMFEVLQDTRLNKQLLYVLVEVCLYEIFPELNDFSAHTT